MIVSLFLPYCGTRRQSAFAVRFRLHTTLRRPPVFVNRKHRRPAAGILPRHSQHYAAAPTSTPPTTPTPTPLTTPTSTPPATAPPDYSAARVPLGTQKPALLPPRRSPCAAAPRCPWRCHPKEGKFEMDRSGCLPRSTSVLWRTRRDEVKHHPRLDAQIFPFSTRNPARTPLRSYRPASTCRRRR